jgi:hypothetical protein
MPTTRLVIDGGIIAMRKSVKIAAHSFSVSGPPGAMTSGEAGA